MSTITGTLTRPFTKCFACLWALLLRGVKVWKVSHVFCTKESTATGATQPRKATGVGHNCYASSQLYYTYLKSSGAAVDRAQFEFIKRYR